MWTFVDTHDKVDFYGSNCFLKEVSGSFPFGLNGVAEVWLKSCSSNNNAQLSPIFFYPLLQATCVDDLISETSGDVGQALLLLPWNVISPTFDN